MSSKQSDYIVRVEQESLATRTITLVVVAGVAVIVLSLVVVHLMLDPADARISSRLAGAAPREISRIDQTLIDVDESANNYRAAQRHRLQRFEWVDPAHDTVRIPIDRAFELLEEGKEP